ncbi:MAG: Ig-like domain-containing protein, partial [Bacteroidales bacterium]|nr:Ig-like domain-containing protein [Bacteroidales bacterium]
MVGITQRCANPGILSGGPKDITPPRILSSSPERNSINFSGNEIKIYFNEFIQLIDLTNQTIISPPLFEVPDIKSKGKMLSIVFNEALRPNTTYNIFLGNAVTDITENNPVNNFQFAFSTGSYIDSLALEGFLYNAIDMSIPEDSWIMLYNLGNDTVPVDSLPYRVKPYYLSKVAEDGSFRLNNLRDEEMKIFALKDNNANLIYDLPNEEIAFLDSLVTPVFLGMQADTTLYLPDSIPNDSIIVQIPADTLEIDKGPPLQLFLFAEEDSIQQLLDASARKTGLITFSFKYPFRDISIDYITEDVGPELFLLDFGENIDTMRMWYKEYLF